jgi:hypothetical protein
MGPASGVRHRQKLPDCLVVRLIQAVPGHAVTFQAQCPENTLFL